MDDSKIIELYFSRDEGAVEETQKKYGELILSIAKNITGKEEDAEECENDTYLKIWNSIPPEKPQYFRAYIGKIARNCALSLYRKNKSAKRDCGAYLLLSELEECLSSSESTEADFDARVTGEIISSWLYTLKEKERAVFIKRYYYGESVRNISLIWGETPERTASILYSLRQKLKKELERKGVVL